MKLIVGKSYHTKSGYIAKVIRRSEIPTGDYVAEIVIGGVTYLFYFREDGFVANMEYPNMTIVAEVEPCQPGG